MPAAKARLGVAQLVGEVEFGRVDNEDHSYVRRHRKQPVRAALVPIDIVAGLAFAQNHPGGGKGRKGGREGGELRARTTDRLVSHSLSPIAHLTHHNWVWCSAIHSLLPQLRPSSHPSPSFPLSLTPSPPSLSLAPTLPPSLSSSLSPSVALFLPPSTSPFLILPVPPLLPPLSSSLLTSSSVPPSLPSALLSLPSAQPPYIHISFPPSIRPSIHTCLPACLPAYPPNLFLSPSIPVQPLISISHPPPPLPRPLLPLLHQGAARPSASLPRQLLDLSFSILHSFPSPPPSLLPPRCSTTPPLRPSARSALLATLDAESLPQPFSFALSRTPSRSP